MSKSTAAVTTTKNEAAPRSRKRRSGKDDRLAALKECADMAGKSWAMKARSELKQQGRSASGGWPGTMSEARLQVMEAVVPEVNRRGLTPATMTEREEVARQLYAAARHSWLAHRESEDN